MPNDQKARLLNFDETDITSTEANLQEVADQACLLLMEGFEQLAQQHQRCHNQQL